MADLVYEPYSTLKITPHRGLYISSTEPSIFFVHLKNTMVCLHVYPYGSGLFNFDPYGAKTSIHVDSCVSYLEKKLWVGWLPLRDNQSSKFLPSFLQS